MRSTWRTLSRCWLAPGLALALPAAAAAAVPAPAPNPFCLSQVNPTTPSGVTARPPDAFGDFIDHFWVHSSTNLQGRPAGEKFASGLFWFPGPPAPAHFAAFRSAVAVTNPHPTASTGVTVEFYDQAGNLLSAPSFTLGPEATRVIPASALQSFLSATPGLGAARVIGHALPIVGETVHHADTVDLGELGGPVVSDPEAFNLGLNSLQQLQMHQPGKTTLWFGPMPISTTAPLDFLTGNAPLITLANPNSSPTNVTLRYRSLGGIVLPPITVTLPAFGSLLSHELWDQAISFYLNPPFAFDDDFRVLVTSNQPLVGDAILVDLFRGTGLAVGERFRMGSAMLANSHPALLVNPELTYEVTGPGVETMVGLFNPATDEAGPVAVRYYDRNGVALGVDTFASFPRGFMARIGPGLPASPNYPAAGVFAGSMRITACVPGLVGWTMRQGGEHAFVSIAPKKAWGESLTGSNGLEPGPGFAVTVGAQSFVRKVSSLVRVDPGGGAWPGYTTWVNDGAPNAGAYSFRFFDWSGFPRTNASGGPFAGLRFRDTSFTYEDPLVTGSGFVNLSGRVDTTNGGFSGIHVIGDPLREWGIFEEPPE